MVPESSPRSSALRPSILAVVSTCILGSSSKCLPRHDAAVRCERQPGSCPQCVFWRSSTRMTRSPCPPSPCHVGHDGVRTTTTVASQSSSTCSMVWPRNSRSERRFDAPSTTRSLVGLPDLGADLRRPRTCRSGPPGGSGRRSGSANRSALVEQALGDRAPGSSFPRRPVDPASDECGCGAQDVGEDDLGPDPRAEVAGDLLRRPGARAARHGDHGPGVGPRQMTFDVATLADDDERDGVVGRGARRPAGTGGGRAPDDGAPMAIAPYPSFASSTTACGDRRPRRPAGPPRSAARSCRRRVGARSSSEPTVRTVASTSSGQTRSTSWAAMIELELPRLGTRMPALA